MQGSWWMNTCIGSPTGRVPRNCTRTFCYNCRGSRSSGLPEPNHKQDKKKIGFHDKITTVIKPKTKSSNLANHNKRWKWNEPIRSQSKRAQTAPSVGSAGKHATGAMRGKTFDWCHARENGEKTTDTTTTFKRRLFSLKGLSGFFLCTYQCQAGGGFDRSLRDIWICANIDQKSFPGVGNFSYIWPHIFFPGVGNFTSIFLENVKSPSPPAWHWSVHYQQIFQNRVVYHLL